MRTILLGADPELFMRSPNDGAFVSAHGRIPGTKYEPFAVPNGAIQVDGTALEFNIDPADTVDKWVNNIQSVMTTLKSYVPGYNVVAEPVALYDENYFTWEVPAEAHTLGCDPDYCAWTGVVNPRPDPGKKPMRTAAGHIHIGWTDGADIYDTEHFTYCAKVARQMDYYLGVYSLEWDKDPTRRQLYGKAGAFRPKSYGVEYRVLSNRWLANEALMRWVYKAVQIAMADADGGFWAEDKFENLAQHIIDNNILNWQTRWPTLDLGLPKIPEAA